eukprot:Gb_10578 [translate_table: standard]
MENLLDSASLNYAQKTNNNSALITSALKFDKPNIVRDHYRQAMKIDHLAAQKKVFVICVSNLSAEPPKNEELKPIQSLTELETCVYHYGQILPGTLCVEPYRATTIASLLEDDSEKAKMTQTIETPDSVDNRVAFCAFNAIDEKVHLKAAVVMLHVIKEIDVVNGNQYENHLPGAMKVDKSPIHSFSAGLKQKCSSTIPIPASPDGDVLDASFSCESENNTSGSSFDSDSICRSSGIVTRMPLVLHETEGVQPAFLHLLKKKFIDSFQPYSPVTKQQGESTTRSETTIAAAT